MLTAAGASAATLSINGNTPNTSVAGTYSGAFVDAYNSSNSAYPSSFSTNYLTLGNETKSSGPISFSSVPYVSLGLLGELYFVFVLDSQETGGARDLFIDNVTLTVGSTVIWSMSDVLHLNDDPNSANHTLTPLSNGADLALYIPVHNLTAYGFTGATQFVFTATHSQSNNGAEEWRLTNFGVPSGTSFFGPTDPITGPAPVPEPSTLGLIALAAGGILCRSKLSGQNR